MKDESVCSLVTALESRLALDQTCQHGVCPFWASGFICLQCRPRRTSHITLKHKLLLLHSTRWTTTISSKVNLPHAINFRVLCGAKLVTLPLEFRGNETSVAHRVDPPSLLESAQLNYRRPLASEGGLAPFKTNPSTRNPKNKL